VNLVLLQNCPLKNYDLLADPANVVLPKRKYSKTKKKTFRNSKNQSSKKFLKKPSNYERLKKI
jgi:hypothetical protein